MKKIVAFIGVVVMGIFSGGIFGIIHDQISYTISPEYYTDFKFQQFGMPDYFLNRVGVAIVGWSATWWFGLILGIILATFLLKGEMNSTLLLDAGKMIGITLLVAAGIGGIGLLAGFLLLDPSSENWMIPADVINKKNFLAVGAMHTLSYLGGLIGFALAIIYHRRVAKKQFKML